MRDVLAALSVGLSPIAIFLLVFLLVFLLSITSFLILVLLFMAPYAMGILGAAFSGRKGFDALFPVSIGGVLSIITFFVLFHIIPFLNIWVIFLLLGATTYVVIQKVRMRSR